MITVACDLFGDDPDSLYVVCIIMCCVVAELKYKLSCVSYSMTVFVKQMRLVGECLTMVINMNMMLLKLYKILVLIMCLSVLFGCAHQVGSRTIAGYDRIVHPGNLPLYYSQTSATGGEPFSVIADGKDFHVYGKAVRPSIQSIYLLENIVINLGDVVLDLGTGSGIQAVFAAQNALKVIATDIGKDAVASAENNVKRFGLEKEIDVRLGDLFEPITKDEKFDVIINNINYPEDENNDADPLWGVHERFFKEVRQYLKKNGRIYYQSGFLFNIPRINQMLSKNDLQITEMQMKSAATHSKELIVYTIQRRRH